jgi:hypothetical protein
MEAVGLWVRKRSHIAPQGLARITRNMHARSNYNLQTQSLAKFF